MVKQKIVETASPFFYFIQWDDYGKSSVRLHRDPFWNICGAVGLV